MNSEFKAFSKIGQYRNAVKDMVHFFTVAGAEQLHFQGTVKLHGTNSAINYCGITGQITCQSRTRIITPEDDNYGFASWVDKHKSDWQNDLVNIGNGEDVTVYGEWFGEGIQSGVALSKVSKRFAIFKVLIGGVDIPLLNVEDIQMACIITEFKHWHRTIKLDTIESMSNEFAEITEAVEKECPVGKSLGVSGIGEGVVWKCLNTPNDSSLIFKVKGQKHSVSKVKKLASIDPVKLASINDFIEYAATVNRFKQGIEVIGLDQALIGQYIKWVNQDIHSEEIDVLQNNDLTMKDVGKQISNKARQYYLKSLEQKAF